MPRTNSRARHWDDTKMGMLQRLTFKAAKLALLPGYISKARCIRRDKDDHGEQDKSGPSRRILRAIDKDVPRILG